MKMKEVLAEELDKIRIGEEDLVLLRRVADDFIEKLKEKGLRAFVGGSLAKGTMVKKEGRQDVDIFVVFEYSEDILGLEGILRKVDLAGGELSRVHGSRDYFHVAYDNVILEIVPVVENKDPELAENVTDLSLSHVRYVAGEILKNSTLAGEIMLAKTFARANRCYGAEGYIRGFSGYSLEILVIHFGSFVKFLKGISKKRVVDPMGYFKGEREIMREINSSKLQGPVVVVDPTYKYRNVCAGLGLVTFERFLEVAAKFLKKPSLDFFKVKGIDVLGLKDFAAKKGARFLELELFSDRQEGDIAGTKMMKVLRFFERELVRAGQEVLAFEFDYSGKGKSSKGYLVVLERSEIERKGPSVGLEKQAKEFCRVNEGCFKRRGFWWCREKVSVEGVLEFVGEREKEMGAKIRICS